MALTLDEIRHFLMADEPDYEGIAELIGPESVDNLRTIVEEGDPSTAPQATYLVSLIPSQKSLDILKIATRSQDPRVRAASIPGLAKLASTDQLALQNEATTLLESLSNDGHAAVKNEAIKALAG